MMESWIDAVKRQDRAIVAGALAALSALAWIYTAQSARDVSSMRAGFMFSMWVVMSVAMLTPAGAPMLFAFSRITRQYNERSRLTRTAAFLLGYLVLWTGFSFLAAALQMALDRFGVLSPMLFNSTNTKFSGGLLIAAGAYQFTPWKLSCLRTCRIPLGFLMTEWREGLRGAFIMGLRHGLYCVGCCWMLMLLLFVGGTLDLVWIAVLSVIVLAEKALTAGRWFSNGLGVAALFAGVWLLSRPEQAKLFLAR